MKIHPTKGVLTPAGNRFDRLKGKMVELYADEKGNKHELDGTEVPMEEAEKVKEKMQVEKQESEKESKLKEMEDEMEFEKNLGELDEKEAEREEKIRKHAEVLNKVEDASHGIVEAVKAIPKPVDHIKEFKSFKDELVLAIQTETDKLDKEIDLSPVIKAIKAIKIPETKIPEPKDYSKLLKEIKSALPKEVKTDKIEKLLAKIKPFSIPDKLISNGRIKVEVDRIGLGGSGGYSSVQIEDTTHTKINPATEETLNNIDTYLDQTVEARKQTPASAKAINVQIGPGDVISNIPVVTLFEHHQNHEGESFMAQYVDTALDTTTVKFGLTTGAGAATTKSPHLAIECDVYNGAVRIDFYAEATFTGGTPITVVNRNRNIAVPAGTMTVSSGVTSTNGTLIESHFVGAGTRGSGSGGSRDEWILKPSTVYRIDLTGLAAGTDAILHLNWYEDQGV